MPRFTHAWLCCAMLAATIAPASVARGQGGQDALTIAQAQCDVDETVPGAVAKAVLFLEQASNASGDDLKALALRSAGKALTDPMDHNPANQSGRAFELGRVAASWLALENQSVVVSRGSLGFLGGDTAAKVDLSIVIDSGFTVVAKALPKCVPLVNIWRERSGGFFRIANLAIQQVNDAMAEGSDTAATRLKLDSATATASYSGRMSKTNPYPPMVFGEIAEAKGDAAAAIADYTDSKERTRLDTLYDPVRRELNERLGKVALDAANATKDTTRKRSYLAAAKEAFSDLAKEPGTDGAKIARDGLTAVAIQSGDTASIKSAYLSTLNNPDATYLELLQAGFAADAAAKAGLKDATFDELRCFHRAVEMNPFHRDGLYNLAIVLATADSGPAARPFVDRLLNVDPAGVSNYAVAQSVYAFVQRAAVARANHYAEVANTLTKPADADRHRAYADSAAIFNDSATAFVSTSLGFSTRKDSVFVGVEVTGWVPTDAGIMMGGTMTNRTATATTVTMQVDFLDKAGTLVSSQNVGVVLEPNGTKDFTVTGSGAGITAFRYTLTY